MAISRFFKIRSLAAMLLECCLVPNPASALSSTSTQPAISVVTVQTWTNASAREQLAAFPKDPCSLDVLPQEPRCEGPRQRAEEWLHRNSRNRCQALLLDREIGGRGPAGDVRR